MRTTLDLPDDLFRALKAQAALEDTTLKELVPRLVRVGLASGARGAAPRVPSALPAPVRGGRRKLRAYTNAELAELAESLADR